MSKLKRLSEIAGVFFKLGLMSFGGPVAHLSYLREEFVAKRHWLDDEGYAELVALCQFIPGPASSQVVFALGMQRAGLAGAILASVCFTLPSALLMILFGYGIAMVGDLGRAGWLRGLKLAAVAVVAQAVWGMGKRLCPDWQRIALALTAAAAVLLFPTSLIPIAVIAVGGGAGWWLYRRVVPRNDRSEAGLERRHLWAAGALVVFVALLITLPTIAAIHGEKDLRVFDSFYRAGSLVFGGGHVVLPLLRAEVVPPGWISDDAFLAGYGLVQAVPGPLFTFAAYLGTVIHGTPHAWWGGLQCLLAIFLPAWLLIGGALPFWNLLRSKTWAHAALRGANAAVVGILLAALYNPLWKESVTHVGDVAAVVVAFVSLERWRVPPWLVVILCAAAAQWML